MDSFGNLTNLHYMDLLLLDSFLSGIYYRVSISVCLRSCSFFKIVDVDGNIGNYYYNNSLFFNGNLTIVIGWITYVHDLRGVLNRLCSWSGGSFQSIFCTKKLIVGVDVHVDGKTHFIGWITYVHDLSGVLNPSFTFNMIRVEIWSSKLVWFSKFEINYLIWFIQRGLDFFWL